MDRSTTTRLVAIFAIVAVASLAAAGLWYLFLRPSGPAPVAQPSPVASQPAASEPAASQPATSSAPSADASASSEPASGLDGAWTVDRSIGLFADFTNSFVGYRVQEELAGIGGQTAVGRTPDITGSLTLAGTQITAVDVTADLSTLQSDDDRRDGQLHRQALETDQFPQASFTVTSPIELGSVPADGQEITAEAVGDLTLHGVTRTVTIPLKATLNGSTVTVTGSIDIVFADYDMQKPQSFIVLSVDDHGTMEFQLHFTRGA
jgi:polyisoprenoid-binding protein YceI